MLPDTTTNLHPSLTGKDSLTQDEGTATESDLQERAALWVR